MVHPKTKLIIRLATKLIIRLVTKLIIRLATKLIILFGDDSVCLLFLPLRGGNLFLPHGADGDSEAAGLVFCFTKTSIL